MAYSPCLTSEPSGVSVVMARVTSCPENFIPGMLAPNVEVWWKNIVSCDAAPIRLYDMIELVCMSA